MMIKADTNRLARLAAKLKPVNRQSGILSDMHEAADDWRSLGEFIMKRRPWEGLRALSLQNEEQRDKILASHGDQIDADPDFAEIMECGARVIAAGKLLMPDPRGYLHYIDIVRGNFGFLEGRHGFAWADDEEGWPGYRRGPLRVTLYSPDCRVDSFLGLSTSDDPHAIYGTVDILYMADRSRPLEPPLRVKVETEAEARAVYATMADLLRRHCAEILDGVPGAFERLVAAAAERERRLTEKNDRLYGPGIPP